MRPHEGYRLIAGSPEASEPMKSALSALAAGLLLVGCSNELSPSSSLDGGRVDEHEAPYSGSATSSGPDGGSVDECRGNEMCLLEHSPDGPLAGPCGAVAPTETMFPLRPDAGGPHLDFLAVMRAGRAGRPVRLEIELRNPLEMCECPDYAFEPFNDPERRYDDIYAIFPKASPRGHWWGIERAGPVKYVVTGYFTGRMIDHAEFWRAQIGEDQGAPAEGQRGAWEMRHPELCVESWCIIPDKNGNRAALSNPVYGDAMNYWKWIQKMRTAKVEFCEEPRRK